MTRPGRPGRAGISPFPWPGPPPASLPSATSAPARSPSTARPSPAWPAVRRRRHTPCPAGPGRPAGLHGHLLRRRCRGHLEPQPGRLAVLLPLRPPPAPGRRRSHRRDSSGAACVRDPDRRVIPARQLESLWHRADLPVRDKTLWRLPYDTAARADEILGLDIGDLDLQNKTATVTGKGGITRQVNWYTHTAHLLARLIGGRTRRTTLPRQPPPPHSGRRPLDLDPATGRARLSYRRAAECFTTTTGWTLHQLRHTRIRELKDQRLPATRAAEDHRAPLTAHPDRALPRTQPRGGTSLVRRNATRPLGAAEEPQPEPCLPRFFPLSLVGRSSRAFSA